MRKKLLLAALSLVALAPAANAQLQKGNVLVGGDIADISLGLNNGNPFSFSINPKAAYFVQDNIALGGTVTLGLSTVKGGGTTTRYGVGVLGRYYVNDKNTNILKHGRFFGEATVGISGYNYSSGGSTNGLGLSFGPGYAYFITPNVGLEGLLKYELAAGFGNSSTTSTLDLNVGFQIYLPHRQIKKIVHEESGE